MLSLGRFMRRERYFPSYDACPEIYYRFSGKGEYGPQRLDRIVSFFEKRSGESIEGRFADEHTWRPLEYFLNLWESVPASEHTIERLHREGISTQGISEGPGRKLLRERRKLKSPTARQIDYLRQLGRALPAELNRGGAEKLIREHEKAVSEQRQRLEEAPQIESYRRQLEELKPRIHELLPIWTPSQFDDAISYECYFDVVENALDHATSFDLEQLQSGLFFDGLDIERNYYLEFARDPTTTEMRQFQAELFRAYLEAGSEKFDHLRILKRMLPMIRATLV